MERRKFLGRCGIAAATIVTAVTINGVAQAETNNPKPRIKYRMAPKLITGDKYKVETYACYGCGSCIPECPQGAIDMSGPDDTAFIDPNLCNGCGVCTQWCPVNAIVLDK